jgi:polysaccharide export outer membrane protein
MRAWTSVLFTCLLAALAACQSVKADLPPAPQIALGPPEAQPAYRLQPGDVIEIHLPTNPEMNEQGIIAPDGRVNFQYATNVPAGGLTIPDLTARLNGLYGKQLNNPNIQVVLRSQSGTRVYVTGEVNVPTEVMVSGQVSALGAISRAGGFKNTAQTDLIVLIRRDEENRPHLYALDIAAAMEGRDANADVMLQAYDILYVPRDRIGNVSLIFEKLRNAIPFSSAFTYGYYLNSPTPTP